MSKELDLIAIGGGSGGLAVAERAAALGKKVALVDPGPLGGTCVNVGCVPKKVMWYAAHLAHAVQDAPAFGIPAQRGVPDWRRLAEDRGEYISRINDYWDDYVSQLRIARIQGKARFTGPRSIEVNGIRYTAPHVVIATGAKPIVPRLPGADLGMTSDDFFRLRDQPRRVAVIGAGYIGVELAGMLRALGSEVTVVALESRVLEAFDPMVSAAMGKIMRDQGIRLELGFNVTALEGEPGEIRVVGRGDRRISDTFDTVVWAVGRRANTAPLKLEETGVRINSDGTIPVDASQSTNVAGLYAVGDVTGQRQLTPVAIAAGRALAERLFGNDDRAPLDYVNVPTVVFAHPPVATIGLTEPQARARFANVRVYKSRFTPMRYALARSKQETCMKLICVGSKESVVGLHMVGDGVDEILQGFAVAINMGATKADLDRTIAIHPTSAEELVTLKPSHCVSCEEKAA